MIFHTYYFVELFYLYHFQQESFQQHSSSITIWKYDSSISIFLFSHYYYFFKIISSICSFLTDCEMRTHYLISIEVKENIFIFLD